MTVNLAWRDAMVGVIHTAADYDAGFAPSIAHTIIAAIQRPYERTPVISADVRLFGSAGYQHMMAMHGQIEADCVAGKLKHTVRDTKLSGSQYMIAAADFAAWLASHGEPPSKHVVAWFVVQGVAWPPVGIDAAAVGASPFPLADFDALVAYRKANTKGEGRGKRGPSWALGNQIEIGKAELVRRTGVGVTESEALNAMGRALGIRGREPRTPLKKALFGERKRPTPTKTPSPLPGVVTVRDGKKAA